MTAPALATPSDNEQTDTLRPTLTVRNATSDQTGTRIYEFQISDSSGFASTASHVSGYAATVSKTGVPEGAGGTTGFTPDQDLQPTTLFYWRARAIQGTSTGPWSPTGRFKSKLVGFSRPDELYDPLIHGETVGERIGSTDFIPGRGIRLNSTTSYVRYLLPQTVPNGEFSMEVEGLQANGPGDKAKVFGMQEGQDDYITNRYRVDIQYRGTAGFPANAITYRVLYGDDPCCKYEPDTDVRVPLRLPAQPIDDLLLEVHVGTRDRGGQDRAARGRRRRDHDALQRVSGDAERPVHAEPALRVSGRANGSQRLRVGVDSRHDLPECLAVEPAQASLARQRAALRLRWRGRCANLTIEGRRSARQGPSERLCYSDMSRMFRRQFLIGVGATLVTAASQKAAETLRPVRAESTLHRRFLNRSRRLRRRRHPACGSPGSSRLATA